MEKQQLEEYIKLREQLVSEEQSLSRLKRCLKAALEQPLGVTVPQAAYS